MENNSSFYATYTDRPDFIPVKDTGTENNPLLEEALKSDPGEGAARPESEEAGNDLVFTPLNWGSGGDSNEKSNLVLAQADTEGEEQEKEEKPQEKKSEEEIAREQEEKLKQSLRAAFLKPEDGSTKKPEEIVKSLEQIKLPSLDKIENIEDLDIPEIDDRIEFEPDLWHKIKENPLISILVAYGGYQVIKQGRKFVLQRNKSGGESAKAPETAERNRGDAETKTGGQEETRVEEPRRRRSRIIDGQSPTKFEERVESERNGSGAFEKRVASGSEAIAGRDRVTEKLTRTEMDSLKEEIKRLSESKLEAENKRASNLKRVVTILENSESPKVQEAAHKYIKNRMAEAREAEARRGRGARIGAAVGIGIIVSAALAYYASTLDNSPDPEENERASVSGK